MNQSMLPQMMPDNGIIDGDPDSPLVPESEQSQYSDIIQEQLLDVEMNENILIGSRSQVSSFVVQGDRIQSLERDNLNLNVQIQKLQSQLRSSGTEKDKQIKEKADLEIRLR